MSKRNYIGLACTGHDNALAIVDSQGKVVFAEATERYLQNKRAVNYPPDDMFRIGKLIEKYCDKSAEIVLAKTWSDNVKSILSQESEKARQQLEACDGDFPEWLARFKVYRHLCTSLVPPNYEYAGKEALFYCTKTNREIASLSFGHHLTHAATACYTSPYSDAVCAVADGFGEGASLAFFSYKNGEFQRLDATDRNTGGMASLGLLYGMVICGLCGFNGLEGEEWKVMGLAPYGKLDGRIYAALQRYLQVEGFELQHPDTAEDAYRELLAYARKPDTSPLSVADLAYTGQQFFADTMSQLLASLYELGISENLVLGGGCALNSSFNGQVLERTKFKKLHVYSAPADDGNAIGAALLAYYGDNPGEKPAQGFGSPYLGSEMSDEVLTNLQRFGGIKRMAKLTPAALYPRVATILSEGKIIGWVQGRAEFGPRALGNRSILADPRRAEMKEKINGRVKFREEFRPFAPSILHEFGDEYFLDYQEAPYMERTLRFREEVKEKVPAVVHGNGTGRLQTVKREWNERYYNLITAFYEKTGIPLLLNTSLNVMGKPIVHSVEDTIALFCTTGLDAMVIGDLLIEKEIA